MTFYTLFHDNNIDPICLIGVKSILENYNNFKSLSFKEVLAVFRLKYWKLLKTSINYLNNIVAIMHLKTEIVTVFIMVLRNSLLQLPQVYEVFINVCVFTHKGRHSKTERDYTTRRDFLVFKSKQNRQGKEIL